MKINIQKMIKHPDDIDLARIVFIAGFARGGTTWTRTILAFHDEVQAIPKEVTFSIDEEITPEYVRLKLFDSMENMTVTSKLFAMKAPINALAFPKLADILPQSKFVFVVRDPRDVFTSFKMGTVKWMGGKNKDIVFCLSKQKKYIQSYYSIADRPNVYKHSFEGIHQNFPEYFRSLCDFLNIDSSHEQIEKCMHLADFQSLTGRTHNQEKTDEGARRGLVGEWAQQLTTDELLWIKNDPFWAKMMSRHGYSWETTTTKDFINKIFIPYKRTHFENNKNPPKKRTIIYAISRYPTPAIFRNLRALCGDKGKILSKFSRKIFRKHRTPDYELYIAIAPELLNKKNKSMVRKLKDISDSELLLFTDSNNDSSSDNTHDTQAAVVGKFIIRNNMKYHISLGHGNEKSGFNDEIKDGFFYINDGVLYINHPSGLPYKRLISSIDKNTTSLLLVIENTENMDKPLAKAFRTDINT